MKKDIYQIIADIADEVRRIRVWKENDEEQVELWFDGIMESLNKLK